MPTEKLIEKLLLGGLMIVVLLLMAVLLRSMARTRGLLVQAWTTFAQSNEGLRVERDERGWPQLVGTYRGVPVRVWAARYSSSSGEVYTHLTASCRWPLPDDFSLSHLMEREDIGVHQGQLIIKKNGLVMQEDKLRSLLETMTRAVHALESAGA